MGNIKCKKGKCWDEDSETNRVRDNCDPDDIVCQTEADLLEEQMDQI